MSFKKTLPLLLGVSLAICSCKPSDSSIKTAVETAKNAVADLSGVSVSVSGGVVTLTGQLKDDATKSQLDSLAGAVKGVTQVVDNCTVTPPPPPVAPVVISADDSLTTRVNDAIKDYPGVKATVQNGVVTLTGEIKRADLQKLMPGLSMLKPKKIDNQLTVK